MKKIKFTPPYINKRGREGHKSGTISNNGVNGICFYGFDRIPRKLKKQAKSIINGNMIWIFSKPSKSEIKDPGFMWLECFKTILWT